MKVSETTIQDVLLVDNQVSSDNRGDFVTFWEDESLSAKGIKFNPANAHFSHNREANTLRGMHYQASPYEQAKLVSCVSGSLWDVVVDLRETSKTYLKWVGVNLEEKSGKAIYIPKGCAHGFMTLASQTTIAYLIEGEYQPEAARAIRWNDPFFNIDWPSDNPVVSDRDNNISLFDKT